MSSSSLEVGPEKYEKEGASVMRNVSTTTSQQEFANFNEPVKVFIASSDQEKLQVYRLRYQVYVEEMGRNLPSADHKNKLLTDELDDWSVLIYAKAGEEVIGTVRLNIGTVDIFPADLVQDLHMDKFQAFYKNEKKYRLGFCSKYLVALNYRKSQVAYLVGAQLYEIYRDYQVQFSFAGCNPYMIPLYEHIGFRRFAQNFTVTEYGCMVPLVWLMEDIVHLYAVRSPFFRNARKRENSPAAAEWFKEQFPTASKYVNSRLISEEELWELLTGKLGRSPILAIFALHGLTEAEAKKILQIGVIHTCRKGEKLISHGDIANELNILLTGTLQVSNPGADSYPTIVAPGNIFGKATVTSIQSQVLDVMVMTDVEYLVISGMAFEKFHNNHPVLADKIMRNIRDFGSSAHEPILPNAM